jgi:hypothetical protein
VWETWSLTLREEHRLRVFTNSVIRRVLGPRRDELTGDWRELQNEELHNLYFSPNISRMIKSKRMRWAGHIARRGEKRNPYRILVGNPEGKRPLGRWWTILKYILDRTGCYILDRPGSA